MRVCFNLYLKEINKRVDFEKMAVKLEMGATQERFSEEGGECWTI